MSARTESPPDAGAPTPAGTAPLEWRIPGARRSRPPFLFDRRFWIGLLAWGVGVAAFWTFDESVRIGAVAVWTGLGLLAWQFVRYRDRFRTDDEPHFTLDDEGLAWRDSAAQPHRFPAEKVRSFRLGLDADTERPIAALVLQLADGQESQPIELEPPATSPTVRSFLIDRWGIAERRDDDASRYAGYLRVRLRERTPTPTVRRLSRWALIEPWHERGEWLLAEIPGRGKLFFDDESGLWRWEDFKAEPLTSDDLDSLLDRLSQTLESENRGRAGAAAERLRGANLPASLDEPLSRREAFLKWFARQWEDELPADASELTIRAEQEGPGRFHIDGEWHGAASWFFQGTYEPVAVGSQSAGPGKGVAEADADQGSLAISRFSDLQRTQQAFQRAAKTLGMLVRFQTDEGRWQFVGSRDAFEEWTDWIASHAAAMKPRDAGIRLPTYVWGNEPIRIAMTYSPIPYVEDGRLAGPEEFFDHLVENLRTMLNTWPAGKEAQVHLFPRKDPPFLLSFRERRIEVEGEV
ncbi:MAG TPA: hypothetical protein VGN57_17185 [Pirellulaceae bacterium]|nr:hypothetical protein [Pirellulaceae bacterium]